LIHRLFKRKLGRRGAFALEFALVAPFFLVMLFVVFEVSYDEFMQEVLDNALQSAARQVQIGNTQAATSSTFVQNYFCPYGNGLLNCNSLYLRIQSVSFNAGSCSRLATTNATGDYYDATMDKNGANISTAPSSNGVLQLADYYSGAGTAGTSSTGSAVGLSSCATSNSSSGYCNAGPQELMLMSAVYVAPSFLDGLLLNHFTYGGKFIRPIFSTAAFETESFAASTSLTSEC
jgi:Flp pilus assembly protein TadG